MEKISQAKELIRKALYDWSYSYDLVDNMVKENPMDEIVSVKRKSIYIGIAIFLIFFIIVGVIGRLTVMPYVHEVYPDNCDKLICKLFWDHKYHKHHVMGEYRSGCDEFKLCKIFLSKYLT